MKKIVMAVMVLSMPLIMQSWQWSDVYSWFWKDDTVEREMDHDKLLQEVKREINSQNGLKHGQAQYLNDGSYSMLMGMLIDARETMGLKSKKFKNLLTDIQEFLKKNRSAKFLDYQQKNKIKAIAAKYDL